MRVIADVTRPDIIQKILEHVARQQAAGIQRDEHCGNGSLKPRNGRDKQTRLVDQRLPDQPPRVCASGHASHQPFA